MTHRPFLLAVSAIAGLGLATSPAVAGKQRSLRLPVAKTYVAKAPGAAPAAPSRKATTRVWRSRYERRASALRRQQGGARKLSVRSAPIARAAEFTTPLPAVLGALNQPGLGPAGLRFEPDTTAAIGPEYFVQIVNGQGVGVFRRSDLGQVSRVDAKTFLDGADGEIIDPQVMWDSETRRFYYVFTRPTPAANHPNRQGHVAYGWSKTDDPSDLVNGWCHLEISTGSTFDDNPKVGDNASHLVLTSSVGAPTGNFARVFTIPKPAAGTTCPGSVSGIKTFGSPGAPLETSSGVQVDWPVPALGADGGAIGWVFSTQPGSASRLMSWSVGSDGVLVRNGNITVRPYSVPSDAKQPAPYDTLDTQENNLTQAVAMRSPEAPDQAVTSWTSHTIADPSGSGRSIVRWYELAPTRCSVGSCPANALRQVGDIKNPSAWVFNGAISPTHAGNEAVVNYNVSGTSLLPQVRARSRMRSQPVNDLGPEITLETSDAATADASCGPGDGVPACRWGDYAAAVPDPYSPHLVWGSNMAVGPQTPGVTHWKTRNFALRAAPGAVLVHAATSFTEAPGGDGDGLAEPKENILLTETLRNVGNVGLAATGQSSLGSRDLTMASVPGSTSGWPAIAAGATAQNLTRYNVRIGNGARCGSPVKLQLTIFGSDGKHAVPVTPLVGRPAPVTQLSNDVPKDIPDGSATGLTSNLVVDADGTVGDIDVTVADLVHTYVGDLKVELIGPDGTTVVLTDRPGGANNEGDNLTGTIFDDEAAASIQPGGAPYTGRFRPQGALSAFDGKPVRGTWQLRVSDLEPLDRGTLRAWGTTTSAPAPGGGSAPGAAVSTSGDLALGIPDNLAAGVTSALPVEAAGKVADLDVTIAGLTHTWDGDLRLELIGPDGTSAVLADRPGGANNAGDNMSDTVFDDEASTVISAGTPPYRGAFKPQVTPLSVFDGKDAAGTWRLKVSDLGAQDTGSLTAWGTHATPQATGGCS